MQEAARLIAEAQIDVHRVRQTRHQFLTAALRDPHYDSRANLRAKARLLDRLLLQPNIPEILKTALTNVVLSAPQGDDKLALILSQEAKRLQALDRYERRALSRRNRAVQEFDCAVACKYL